MFYFALPKSSNVSLLRPCWVGVCAWRLTWQQQGSGHLEVQAEREHAVDAADPRELQQLQQGPLSLLGPFERESVVAAQRQGRPVLALVALGGPGVHLPLAGLHVGLIILLQGAVEMLIKSQLTTSACTGWDSLLSMTYYYYHYYNHYNY